MKSFFNKTNIDNIRTIIKYEKLNLNDFLKNYNDKTFKPNDIFFILLKYKKELLYDESSITYFLSKFLSKEYSIEKLKYNDNYHGFNFKHRYFWKDTIYHAFTLVNDNKCFNLTLTLNNFPEFNNR